MGAFEACVWTDSIMDLVLPVVSPFNYLIGFYYASSERWQEYLGEKKEPHMHHAQRLIEIFGEIDVSKI